jgi:hypothetical protein
MGNNMKTTRPNSHARLAPDASLIAIDTNLLA